MLYAAALKRQVSSKKSAPLCTAVPLFIAGLEKATLVSAPGTLHCLSKVMNAGDAAEVTTAKSSFWSLRHNN